MSCTFPFFSARGLIGHCPKARPRPSALVSEPGTVTNFPFFFFVCGAFELRFLSSCFQHSHLSPQFQIPQVCRSSPAIVVPPSTFLDDDDAFFLLLKSNQIPPENFYCTFSTLPPPPSWLVFSSLPPPCPLSLISRFLGMRCLHGIR